MAEKTLKQRFQEKIWINFESGCWEWTAARSWYGYGRVRVGNAVLMAHRVVYEMYVEPVPSGRERRARKGPG